MNLPLGERWPYSGLRRMVPSERLLALRVFLGTREAKFLVAILAVALVVQIVYFARIQSLYPPYGLTSEHYYSPLAVNVLQHRTYGFGEYPDIERTTKRPPFYSLVLAGVYGLFGENERNGLLMNNVFLWLTIIVVYLIGRKLSPVVGLLAALLFVLDPIVYITANKNQADILYVLLIAGFLIAIRRNFTSDANIRMMLLSSFLLVLATMTRAVSVYLWLPMLVAFVVTHRLWIKSFTWKRIGVLVAAFFAVQMLFIGGWMVRNYGVSGNPDFASEQRQLFNNFYGPLVVARATGQGFKETSTRLMNELAADPEYLQLDRGVAERYELFRGIRMVLDNPMAAAQVYLEHVPVLFINFPINSVTLFFDDARREEIADLLGNYQITKSSRLDVTGYLDLFRHFRDNGLLPIVALGALYKLYYAILLIGLIAGSARLLTNRASRPTGMLLVAFIGYMVFASSFWPIGRLRIPITPASSIVALYGIYIAWVLKDWLVPRLPWIRKR